jgi:uncharacterized membrane protein required for colicin V production
MNGVAWSDALIAAVLIFGTLKGFKVGLVNELAGAVALALALGAFFTYPGTLDRTVRDFTHLAPSTAHIVAMTVYAALVYFVTIVIGGFLARIAKLPLINLVNAVGGAFVGLVKAGVLVWAIVYVMLFFPLTKQVRDDMHASRFIAVAQEPNEAIDASLRGALPLFVKPYAEQMFAHHRV